MSIFYRSGYSRDGYFGNKYEKFDLFFWPYHLKDGNRIALREQGVDLDVELEVEGDIVWAHDQPGSDYPSLYINLEERMEAAGEGSTNNYNFTSTQGGAPDTLKNRKLHLEATNTNVTWDLNFGSSSWTMDKRFFGFSEDEQRIVEPTSDEITSPYMYWGAWAAPVVAHDKRRYRKKSSHLIVSGGRSGGTFTSSAAWDARKFVYRFVKSPHVFNHHANHATRAAEAGIDQYDNNNAFEHLWAHADVGPIICLHHHDMNSGIPIEDPWEALRWIDDSTLQEFDQVLTYIENADGEVYDIEFEMAILESTFAH